MTPVYRLLARLFALTCFSTAANAAPGDLDGSFGAGGMALNTITTTGQAYDVAVQPDGKIVAVAGPGFYLLRYNEDGSPDSGFGVAGRASATGAVDLRSVAIQPDGKIVVAGRDRTNAANHKFFLARFNADGTLDPGFGTGGKVARDLDNGTTNNGDMLLSVAIQPDGRIVAAGHSAPGTDYDAADARTVLLRVMPDGAIDTSFGTDTARGQTVFAPTGNTRWAELALDAGNRIYTAGSSILGSGDSRALVARFSVNGTLDTTWGDEGWAELQFTAPNGDTKSTGQSVVVQPDGKVLVGGKNATDYVIFRLREDAPAFDSEGDNAFSGDGVVVLNIAGADGAYGVELALQDNGRILVVGASVYDNASGGINATLARLEGDGSLDTSFANNGIASIPLAPQAGPEAPAGPDGFTGAGLRKDGDIIVGGVVDMDVTAAQMLRVALARYVGDRGGMPDMTCRQPDGSRPGTGTIITPPLTNGSSVARDVVALPDNGFAFIAGGSFYTTRYGADGKPFAGFGNNGVSTAASGQSAMAIGVQSTGSLVLAGYTGDPLNPGSNDFRVTRLLPNGNLDATFGNGGYAQFPSNNNGDILNALLVNPDDSIIVGGRLLMGGNTKFALAKLDANGVLDETGFGAGGIVVEPAAGNSGNVMAIARHGEGYLAVGYATFSGNYRYVVARFDGNGALDTEFGIDGVVVSPFAQRNRGYDLEVLPNGGFIVVGQLGNDSSDSSFLAVRYAADGTIDVSGTASGASGDSFVGDGIVLVSTGMFDGAYSYSMDSALQADGKLLIAGGSAQTQTGYARRSTVIRLNTDGTLDSTFNADGVAHIDIAADTGDHETLTAIAVKPNGRIVAVGAVDMTPGVFNNSHPLVVCLHP